MQLIRCFRFFEILHFSGDSLIGKKGANVQALQRETNCDINFESVHRVAYEKTRDRDRTLGFMGRDHDVKKTCFS